MLKVSPLLVLAFSFSLGMTGGCSPAGPPPPGEKTVVKVAFWGSPEEIEIIIQSTKSWEAQHPDIGIRYEHTPFSGYTSKILTRIAGGAPPDIIATEVNMFVSFASKQVLEDLMPYARRDVNFNAGDFFPEVIKRFTVEGKLLAIPRDTAPFACVYYNKDLFDRAGVPYPTDDWTWDDFLEKAQQLTVNDAQGRVLQYGFYGWAWQNFVYSSGGALVDDVEHPTRCLLDLPESKRGLQFAADLINKHKVMPAPVALANMGMGVDLMFSSGRLAMFLSGIWETPALRQRPFRWDVVMFPIGPGGHRRIATGGTGYAMLKGSKVKKEAWEVIKALTGPEGQAELARRGLAQPARREVAEGPDFAGHEALPENKKMLNEAVQYVLYDPFHPKWREIEAKVVAPELDLLFNGKQGVEETAAKIVPLVNELLKTKE
jgi:multiple sugar transport system substrate-binding protein